MKKLLRTVALIATALVVFAGCASKQSKTNKGITLKIGLTDGKKEILAPVEVNEIPEGKTVSELLQDAEVSQNIATTVGINAEDCDIDLSTIYSDVEAKTPIASDKVVKDGDTGYLKAKKQAKKRPSTEGQITIKLGLTEGASPAVVDPIEISGIPSGLTLKSMLSDEDIVKKITSTLGLVDTPLGITYSKNKATYYVTLNDVYADPETKEPFAASEFLEDGAEGYLRITR